MTIEELERVKKAVIRKYPISVGLALRGKEIELSKSVPTAAVVGERNSKGKIEAKKIKVNPDFFDNLTFSERVFVLAHEACHIALRHFSRAMDKPEKDAQKKYEEYCQKESDEQKRKQMKNILQKRYHNIWNIATDACINAFLKKDGLSFPEHVIDPQTGKEMKFVDIEDGLYRSAEKIYDFLVKQEEEKEKEKEQQNNQQGQQSDQQSQQSDQQGQQSQQGQQNNNQQQEKSNGSRSKSKPSMGDLDDIDVDDYNGFDSHEEWTGDQTEPDQKEDQNASNSEDSEQEEEEQNTSEGEEVDESEEEIDEEEIFEKEIESRKNSKKMSLKEALSKVREGIGLNDNVSVKPVVSWKRLLVGTLEKVEEVWGTRRSSRYNPNARIEERTFEENPSVEVILDVSGSISNELLRGFLLQLRPLFEELYGDAKMKVGCFADTFSGFVDIRTKKDIINFSPNIGGGTNFEVAATSFTNDPGHKITKIVFTDGCLGRQQQTRVDDIIWIVFGNSMDFTPVGGRIIKISDEELKNMTKIGFEEINFIEEEKGFSR